MFGRACYRQVMEDENADSQSSRRPDLSAEEYEQHMEWELKAWADLILDFYEKYGPHVEEPEASDEEPS